MRKQRGILRPSMWRYFSVRRGEKKTQETMEGHKRNHGEAEKGQVPAPSFRKDEHSLVGFSS